MKDSNNHESAFQSDTNNFYSQNKNEKIWEGDINDTHKKPKFEIDYIVSFRDYRDKHCQLGNINKNATLRKLFQKIMLFSHFSQNSQKDNMNRLELGKNPIIPYEGKYKKVFPVNYNPSESDLIMMHFKIGESERCFFYFDYYRNGLSICYITCIWQKH